MVAWYAVTLLGLTGKVRFFCQDETRIGLKTISGRKITARGVKPKAKVQWQFQATWLYGIVEPATGESFFYEFSHLIPNHKREATDRASSMESLPTREAITDLVISERRFLTKSRNSSIFLGKENLNPCFKCSQTRSIGFNSGE